MKRDLSPVSVALLLILGCVVFRLLSSLSPGLIPNASPLMALAYIGGMTLPRRWGWLVAPVTAIVTGLVFIPMTARVTGYVFPWWTLASLPVYFLASGFGLVLAEHRTLLRILAGSLFLSVFFYVASNTFCWAGSVLSHSTPGYPPGWAGWWQANSTGLPGYVPSWVFLRNGVLGDLTFSLVFLAILDRATLFRPAALPAPRSV